VLSTEEIREAVWCVTYRPGWSFEVYEGRFEGPHIVIRATVPDSTRLGQAVTLAIHSMLPPMRNRQAVFEWLAWRLGRIEVHEMREWLKVDGRVIFDPHALGAEHDR
jgi:hypothetical protein